MGYVFSSSHRYRDRYRYGSMIEYVYRDSNSKDSIRKRKRNRDRDMWIDRVNDFLF